MSEPIECPFFYNAHITSLHTMYYVQVIENSLKYLFLNNEQVQAAVSHLILWQLRKTKSDSVTVCLRQELSLCILY